MSSTGPPGPGKRDIVAMLPDAVRNDPLQSATALREDYGDVVKFPYHPSVGGSGYLVCHPDDIRTVLLTEQTKFRAHETRAREDFKVVMGEGLVTSDGDHWLRQTRMITPMFHKQSVERFCDLFVREARRAAAEHDPGEEFELLREAKRIALRIIGQALFSTNLEEREPDIYEALTTLRNGFKRRNYSPVSPPLWMPTPENRRIHEARDLLWTVAEELIEERRGDADAETDLLSLLLTAEDEVTGESMTDEEVRDEVITFLIAGHTTIAAALTWTWYLLASNPAAHRRLYESVRDVDLDSPSLETIGDLEEATRVVKETLRLYPSVPLMGRETDEPVELGGYDIPESATLIISPYLAHRDARFWECPSAFDPDRFRPERSDDRHEFAYFPFSAGSHMCTGRELAMLELPLVISAVVAERRWTFADGTVPDVDPDFGINLEPDNPIEMRSEPWP
ncbi:MAG: cytochrome P450 [Natronomonas sp.]|jgi:cytochrome P450|uniref:cytochrome P450 n=1 Tax=Natronomonas sp. TaxID=2184060 RepID=UPI0039892F37